MEMFHSVYRFCFWPVEKFMKMVTLKGKFFWRKRNLQRNAVMDFNGCNHL